MQKYLRTIYIIVHRPAENMEQNIQSGSIQFSRWHTSNETEIKNLYSDLSEKGTKETSLITIMSSSNTTPWL